jgi:hypothetical protein
LSIAFNLLFFSVAAAPALIAFDGLAARSLIGVLAVTTLAFVAVTARTADVHFAANATRRIQLAAAIPAIWIVIQILPIPIPALSHSIWINANEALSQQTYGHISIDIGKSIHALFFYSANIALIIAGIFVFKDRRRAELILSVLAAITALTTIALVILAFLPNRRIAAAEVTELLAAVSSLGIILSIAAGARAFERRGSRPTEFAGQASNTESTLMLAAIELLVCIAGLALSATVNVALVALFGTVIFASIQIIRRLGFAGWAAVVFVATLVVAASMIIFWRYDPGSSLSLLLQFATTAPADSTALAQRMLSDTNWPGTGAGTYAPLLPVYQQLTGLVAAPPSTAFVLGVELGRPAAAFVFIFSAGIIANLYLGALNRGRDSCYPAAAAACVTILLGEAFCNASLQCSCVAVLADAVIGLGLAQRISSGTTA